MKGNGSETTRSTYEAPAVEEIGQIHEVSERKVWDLGNETASQRKDKHTA